MDIKEHISKQTYDKWYQDVEVINHIGYANSWKSWDNIKDIFENRTMDTAELIVQDSDLKSGHENFFISHYPHLFWMRGYIHLHGHVHSGHACSGNEQVPFHPLRYDIGIDNNNYKPISYNDLMIIINNNKLNDKS